MDIYRPSDANKWKDKRYRALTFEQKTVYDFLWDVANDAGFYKISDADIDVLMLGPDCQGEKHYKDVVESLCKPVSSPNGRVHRGWLRPNKINIVWCSHFIKHTQDGFGKKKDSRHKKILEILVSNYEAFKYEPEYLELMEDIDPSIFNHFRVDNPMLIESLNKPDVKKIFAKPVPMGNIHNDVIDAWNQIVKPKETIFGNAFRTKAIEQTIRSGFTLADIKSVFTFKAKEWRDDPKMKSHLTIDTILKEEYFQKYLEQAKESNHVGESSKPGQRVVHQ